MECFISSNSESHIRLGFEQISLVPVGTDIKAVHIESEYRFIDSVQIGSKSLAEETS